MNAVSLNGSGDAHEVFVNHRNDRHMMRGGEIEEELIELMNIVRTVVRGQGDPGEQNFDVRVAESSEDRIQIAARDVERKAAQAVIAAELDDDQRGMFVHDARHLSDGVFGGGSAGAAIDDLYVVFEPVEVALEGIWIGLS